MIRLNGSGKSNGCIRWHLLLQIYIVLTIIITSSCTGQKQPYSILEFKGKGNVLNYSKDLMTVQFESDSLNPTAMVAGKGDLIMYGDNFYFCYSQTSGNKFLINTTKRLGYLNGKVQSITIPDNEDLIPWFQKSDTVDFSHLEFIIFNSRIMESYIPYLTHLAKIRPDIGIVFQEETNDMARILTIFNPRILLGGAVSVKMYNMLTRITNLELLSVTLKDSLKNVPLPAMPELEQLILSGTEHERLTGDDFLANNRQIERLSVTSVGTFDFSILKPLVNLKELIINSCDTVVNFNLIKDHKMLEVLVPGWKGFTYNISKNELPALRWITFSSEPTQDEFASFIGSHPKLEVVEIMKNDKINIFEPLLKLRKLHALTIVDTLTDFNTLKSFKNLDYLSLPKGVLDDSLKKTELKLALPDATIVANEGVCLGSGWLLLIVPLVLLFRYAARKNPGRQRDRI